MFLPSNPTPMQISEHSKSLAILMAELSAVSTGVPQVVTYHESASIPTFSYTSLPKWEDTGESGRYLRSGNSLLKVVHKCNVINRAQAKTWRAYQQAAYPDSNGMSPLFEVA